MGVRFEYCSNRFFRTNNANYLFSVLKVRKVKLKIESMVFENYTQRLYLRVFNTFNNFIICRLLKMEQILRLKSKLECFFTRLIVYELEQHHIHIRNHENNVYESIILMVIIKLNNLSVNIFINEHRSNIILMQ